MLPDHYDSAVEFLVKMDSGELNGQVTEELKKLSREQLEQVAQVLMERDDQRKP